ncbi:immune inhibitor A domain-containing protein [Veronia nyctiphanis]
MLKKMAGHDHHHHDGDHHHSHASFFSTFTEAARTDRVLAILIDFPDLPHDDNRLTPELTNMFYPSYPVKHYDGLLFGEGYEGPGGEDLLTMRQFYEQESGGSYSVSGSVAGWYTAKHPAAFYGAKTPSGGNDANARELVREALMALAKDPLLTLLILIKKTATISMATATNLNQTADRPSNDLPFLSG